jgi:hypothetical protein
MFAKIGYVAELTLRSAASFQKRIFIASLFTPPQRRAGFVIYPDSDESGCFKESCLQHSVAIYFVLFQRVDHLQIT